MIPLFKPLLNGLEIKALQGVLESTYLSEGKETEEFERLVAKRCGREYAVAVTSGTVALMIVARIEAIHAIYVPDYCFIAPYNAVKLVDKTVELMDISQDTLSSKSLKNDCNNIFVHFNNRKSNILGNAIHDISHCIGTDFSDIPGTLCISFSAPKSITTGQGGMILTNNKYLANEISRYKNHGKLNSKDETKDYGGNYKYNDILASIGTAQMIKLDYILEAKAEINKEYQKYIKTHNPEIPWLIIYEHPKARDLAKFLQNNEIDAQCLYKPIHKLIHKETNEFPGADWASENLVYLPSYVGLKKEEIKYICERINEYEIG